MTGSTAYDAERLTGYRRDQLAAAFAQVQNGHDWKGQIRAVIPAVDRPVVEQAVLWFTDTTPVFVPISGNPARLLVRAPGYRLGAAGYPGGLLTDNADDVTPYTRGSGPMSDLDSYPNLDMDGASVAQAEDLLERAQEDVRRAGDTLRRAIRSEKRADSELTEAERLHRVSTRVTQEIRVSGE